MARAKSRKGAVGKQRAIRTAPAPGDAASTCDENTATDNLAISTTKRPMLNNATSAIGDAASTRDEHPTNNPTSAIGDAAVTRDEMTPAENITMSTTENPTSDNPMPSTCNNPPTSDTAIAAADQPISLPFTVTNHAPASSASNTGSSNTATGCPASITATNGACKLDNLGDLVLGNLLMQQENNEETAIQLNPSIPLAYEDEAANATPTNDLSAAHSSLVTVLIQDADTTLEWGDSPMPNHDEDELNDETTLPAANAPTKQDAPMLSNISEPVETPNDDVSQQDRSSAETDQEHLNREMLASGCKKRQYRAQVEALEKSMETTGDDDTIIVDERGRSPEPDRSIVHDDKIESGYIPTTIRQLLRTRYKHLAEMDSIITNLTSHIRRPADDDESLDYEDAESAAKNAKKGVTTQSKRSFADFLSNEIKNHNDTMSFVRELVHEGREYRKKLRVQ